MPDLNSRQRRALIGDVVVLLALTIAGFATHLTLGAFGRMIVTILTALLAWAVVSPFFQVYSIDTLENPKALWRVGLAWLVAAPLATFLRGLVLARDIPPAFVVVVILVNGFGLLAWRLYLGWSVARSYRSEARSTSSPL